MNSATGVAIRDEARPLPVAAGPADFHAYLDTLRWSVCGFEARPSAPAASGERPAFLVHSLLGLGLRGAACSARPACAGPCSRPAECPAGRLMEPPPGRGGESATTHRVDASWEPWRGGAPLRFSVTLFGSMSRHGDAVAGALRGAFLGGAGRRRVPCSLLASGWRARRLGPAAGGPTDRTLNLRSPLRLLRGGRVLEAFDLVELVRDLNRRVALWGSRLQGLPWAPRWDFLLDAAARVAVDARDVRHVRFERHSSRQSRQIPLGGVVGRVRLVSVGPDLARLLDVASVVGAGKGGSIGLGGITVEREAE